jgi:hypothetical protein
MMSICSGFQLEMLCSRHTSITHIPALQAYMDFNHIYKHSRHKYIAKYINTYTTLSIIHQVLNHVMHPPKLEHVYSKIYKQGHPWSNYHFVANLQQPWPSLFHRATMSLMVSFLFFVSFFLASSFI